jgi:trimeric autotransporter adhesin
MNKTNCIRTIILAGSLLLQLSTLCPHSRGAADELVNLVTVAGKDADIGDDGPATAAQLNLPAAVAFDSAGNRYITEGAGHRVRKVDPAGIITTFAGTGGAGFNGDNIPATSAQLNFPRGVIVDSSGNLYIVENGGHRVRKVSLATGLITTVAGTGVAASTGDGGPATAAQINAPGFAVFDSTGNLYISEVNGSRIRKVDTAGIITTFAGTGVAGFAGDGGPATAAQFRNPNAICFDSAGSLYIADVNNNRVRMVDTAGIITALAGTGLVGSAGDGGPATAAQLNAPRTVTVDSSDNLYIADFQNNRVRRVDTTGMITTFAGTGVRGFSGDGGLAAAAQLNGPNTVSFDSSGNLYIAESLGQRLRKVDTMGIITTFAGGGSPVLGDGGPATAAQFDPSSGVAFDSSGNLYIADLNNNRIRKVSLATGIITTIAGTGFTGSTGDGGPAIAAQLNGPFAIAFDSSGNLYIADSTGRRVRKVDTAGIITTFAGTGVSGSAGDGGPATAGQVNNPQGVAVDSSGNLYISEFAGHRIRKVSLATGIISTVAGTGVTGFSGDDGPATAARLNTPQGVAVDILGNLYIADVGNSRIRKVDATGIITTVAGTGIRGFSGDGNSAAAATLDIPQGVAVDSPGNLYLADGNRIREVDTTGIIMTVAGTGVGVFSGDGGPATAAQLNGPRGIAVDSSDNLYITDSGNSRIRRLNLATPVDVNPNTLKIARSKEKWVTAYVQFPAGRDASDVNVSSIMLQAINPANGAIRHSLSNQELQIGRASGSPNGFIDTNEDNVPDLLTVKFDRGTVASWTTGAPELVLRVQGQLQPPLGSPVGTYFSGDTQIRNIYAPNP